MPTTSSLNHPTRGMTVGLFSAAMAVFTSGCAHLQTNVHDTMLVADPEGDRVPAEKLAAAIDPTPQLENEFHAAAIRMADVAVDRINPGLDATSASAVADNVEALDPAAGLAEHREIRRLARLNDAAHLDKDIASFDEFLAWHQDVLAALDHDPAIVANTAFLGEHPDLASFLDQHPSLSTALLLRAERRELRLADAS